MTCHVLKPTIQTGIRDKDMLSTLERNLLQPLGSWLEIVIDKGGEGEL